MTLKYLLPAFTAAAALAVAGCGSSGKSSSDTGSSTPAPAASTPASAPTATASGGGAASTGVSTSAVVGLKGIAFNPKSITVKVGQKITWKGEEPVDHNVTADSGASFKSPNFGEGKTFEYTPTKPGTIAYECTIHPGMNGTIIVQ